MIFHKKTIKDIEISEGTRVITRADFNVPLNKDGSIASDYKLRETLPTLEYLAKKGCRTVLMSHLGRPGGKSNPDLSLKPIASALSELLDYPVKFIDKSLGEEVKQAVAELDPSCFLLVENIRFNPKETSNDLKLAETYASYGDIFVQDCFGVSHRSHSSITGIANFLPAVSGLLIEKEVSKISAIMTKPKHPLLAVIGGAKISDKIDVIKKFIEIADMVAIGGAMANTFLKADGMNIGKSVFEKDAIHEAKEILTIARKKEANSNFTFYLPLDGVVAKDLATIQPTRIVDWSSQTIADIEAYPSKAKPKSYEVQADEMILDIGPISASYIAGLSRNAKTVVWNGTLGYTEAKPRAGEIGPFEHGSHTFLSAIEKTKAPKGQFSLVGGGDTTSYVLGVKGIELPDHVSTGGGASLELMAGKQLPGVEALEDK